MKKLRLNSGFFGKFLRGKILAAKLHAKHVFLRRVLRVYKSHRVYALPLLSLIIALSQPKFNLSRKDSGFAGYIFKIMQAR